MPPKRKASANPKRQRSKNSTEGASPSGDGPDVLPGPLSPKRSRVSSRKSSSGDTVLVDDLDLDDGAFPSPPLKKLSSTEATTSTETIAVSDLELDGAELSPRLKTPCEKTALASKKTTSTGKKTTSKTKGSNSPQTSKEGTPSKKTSLVKKVTFDLTSFTLISHFPEGAWKDALADEFKQEYWSGLEGFLKAEFKKGVQIFPPLDMIFNAFKLTPLDEVKVVILGQDPYHDDGQACGLSFSVPPTEKIPSSLRNVFKELSTDISGFSIPNHGSLTSWAKQGMFLLNATLTVEAHKPNSHAKFGWQKFTDKVIKTLSDKTTGVVFILWGNFAHKKEKLVDTTKHVVIKTAHPSGLSWSKFCGCKCFSQANNALKSKGKQEIDWNL